jgi:two-component system NtrC family sensor kinase
MKKIYFLAFVLVFGATNTFAQSSQVFNLNKLSKQDTVLSGWKFHAGDDAQWAGTTFNDSNWQPVDPGQDIQSFTQLKKPGIGWLRLHIRVDGSVTGQELAAWVSQYTASQVYLNGKQILQYGTVSANPSKVAAYLPSREPFDIKLLPHADNVVAVRLAYQPGIPYVSNLFAPLPVFSLSINDRRSALANYRVYQHKLIWFIIFYTFSGAILLIISFIHLVYFLFDRSQKVNLYYFFFCITLCYDALPNEIWGIERFGPVITQMWQFFAGGAAIVPGMLFLLMTIYTLFNYRRRLIFKLLVILAAILIVCQYIFGTLGYIIAGTVFPVICLAEGIYVCIWAIKQQKKDAAFILAGVSLFTILNIISSVLDQDSVQAQVIFEISLISFPIGMSFYLGVQNSKNNRKLKSMLVEVQNLSAQNLAQEQDKQTILSTQYDLLEVQVTERTAQLNQSLTDLKSTQTQLVQREKMASLGELTAGIAHEIQNPLNFVNNFSEVSVELLQELKEEAKAGHTKDVIVIADDLAQNLEKINHHGKRADSIVKGMLEHSKAGTGEKTLTDINALADEFLKLSYHGLRAKDKSFNADLITNFDANLPKVNIAQQDIGRVLLNLFNNAFYAVNQKQKMAGVDYKPEVTVFTSAEKNNLIIKVKDNGNGIPDAIKDKIMQPFFTTKPTGEGTGLGLSLSYDIVVKGHGGTITVDTKDGEGAEFTIQLPAVT